MNLSVLCALIVLLPFVGFLINGIGFKKIPKNLVGPIAVLMALASLIASILLFNGFIAQGSKALAFKYFDWIAFASTNRDPISIAFSFLVDQLTLIMLMVITGVGSLIHVYSIGYMKNDEGYGKFMAFLNLFLFSMLILVLGSNYVVMFIGWEGVGLCSFLLIGFWNRNNDYNLAARKAFVMNRIGDLGFLIGIFAIIYYFSTSEYLEIFKFMEYAKGQNPDVGGLQPDSTPMIFITICLLIGAIGKSAQVPLYTWLPDAMAGPTPVSALIHAATMVTAGIYMVVRSNPLYSLAPTTLHIILIIAIITALLAASIGLFQNDIKKVLAYSTVSQLGYMFLGLGVMAYSAAMFHVITHAFFKALLFLGAGSVIHAIHDQQDIRYMGGLRKYMPITYITFLMATLAIAGIPPFAGFFSKDEILLHLFIHNKLVWGLAVLGAALTSYYMFRVLLVTFNGSFRGTEEQKHHLHESPAVMTFPLILLAILSIVGGFIGIPEVFAKDANWLAHWLEPIYATSKKLNPAAFEAAHLSASQEYLLMGVSVGAALIGLILAYVQYGSKKTVPPSDEKYKGFTGIAYHKYYIDEAYQRLFVKPLHWLSKTFGTAFEKGIDAVVNGFGQLTRGLSGVLGQGQDGNVGFYLFMMVLGILLLLGFNVWIA